jgi:hypothetical protein
MSYTVNFHPEFALEFKALPLPVQDELLAYVELLMLMGHELKRPYADTLKGSNYTNMKELRFKAMDGVWRFAYAFDPLRCCIVLVGGDKSGGSEKRFYKQLIAKADKRFHQHLQAIKEE